MKVPVGWLREFVDFTVEVPRLAEDLTLAGLAVDGIEGKGDDAVLDLDVTTNRVDCMNVYGVAREVSVLYSAPLRPLAVDIREEGPPASVAWTVDIEAPDLCPRFCGRVLDVRIGPSPAWLRARLEQVGVRPISNVVDLTNYVMIEMGQPMHAFDLAKMPEARIVVRWNRPGEKVVDARRTGAHAAGPDRRDRRDARRPGPGRHHGRGVERGLGLDTRDRTGSGLLGRAFDPPRGQGAGHAHGGLAPVRARSGPGSAAGRAGPHRASGGEDRRGDDAARPHRPLRRAASAARA